LRALILVTVYLLSFSPPAPSLTSYSSRCIVQLPAVCHSESCANHVTKLAIILAVSYLQSYSPRPTCYRPRRRRCAHDRYPPHSCRAHRVVLIASCSSRRAHRVVLITSHSSRCDHRVVFISSCSSRRAQHVVSYLPTFLCFRAKCGSSIYRCTLDIMNRTGLSYYAWNPLCVCECDKSICCDVPCLDSQHDRGAITRVVQTPFALTRLRPEGKCRDTAVTARRRRHHLSRTTRVWNVLDGAAQGRFGFWIARCEKVLGFGVLDARRGKVLVARRGKVLVARRGKVLDARQGPGCAAREGSGCAARKGSRCAARKGSAGSGCAA